MVRKTLHFTKKTYTFLTIGKKKKNEANFLMCNINSPIIYFYILYNILYKTIMKQSINKQYYIVAFINWNKKFQLLGQRNKGL